MPVALLPLPFRAPAKPLAVTESIVKCPRSARDSCFGRDLIKAGVGTRSLGEFGVVQIDKREGVW